MGELLTTHAHATTRRLSDQLRVTLDVVRALAASYVVVHHVVVNSELSGPVTYLFRFGQEAVIVFFLLSGFLIFASEQSRIRNDLRGYYLRRLRRIYPLLLVAMAVTAIVVWANGLPGYEFSVSELALNLLATQDVSALKPGVISDPFLGNSPLWSLSYEVFFYLVFPLVMIFRRTSGQHALTVVGAVSLVGYVTFLLVPNHFSLVAGYLLVWWAGAVVADLYRSNRLTFRHIFPVTAWLAALCATASVGVVLFGRSDVGVFPMLPLRHFAFALVCVALAGTALTTMLVRAAQPFASPAAYVASVSYGLYVFHYPLLIQWEAAQTPAGLALAIILLVLVSILGDRLLDRLMPRPATVG
jgi:peptidoglycan/LPS O-acetylase OafA/YrhL